MDFSDLLGLAKEKQINKADIKRYSTNINVPLPMKKKTVKEKKLSENVRKFMEKQEEEERKKKAEDRRKRDNLLAKRSADLKSTRTMKSMLQRTKSSNKSVIAEAVDRVNTADTLAGRNQCDEDDYGYESTAAKSFYDKLMNKYEKNPEDPMAKFSKSNTNGTKDIKSALGRVKSALNAGHDPQPSPSSSSSSRKRKDPEPPHPPPPVKDLKQMSKKEREAEARKRRLQQAQKPAPSFRELMQIAKKSSNTSSNGDFTKIKDVKDSEFHRPMTNKMKEEFKRERLSQLRREGKIPMTAPPPPQQPPKQKRSESSPSSSKSNDKNKIPPPKSAPPAKRDVNSVPSRAFPGEKVPTSRPAKIPPARKPSPPPAPIRDISQVQSRPFPGERKQPSSSSSFNPVKSRNSKRANVIDSDSECDSEMDDFIDDSDAKVDISKEIRSIFGYDRNRYRDEEDFDDRSMEANYSSIMREEVRSAKIGRMEDLEDMKREEEENRRKKERKRRR